MVDVSRKVRTLREARARGRVTMNEKAYDALKSNSAKKGDVLAAANIAGINAAKRTWELIPLCHQIDITNVNLNFKLSDKKRAVIISSEVNAFDRTGVEMEALTAVSVAALTVYDMLKSVDRGMVIGKIRLISKSGGRSGKYENE